MNEVSSAYLEGEVNGQRRRFPISTNAVLRIGRSDKNDIVLSDDLASRHHAMLQRSGDGQFYISDLGSSNGTLVNGVRISRPVILRSGGRITIGSHEFTFIQEAQAHSAEVDITGEFGSTNILFAERLISVLVADIRDFTALGRRLEPAKLSQLIAWFFREAGKALKERGAWEQKYIGDAVMAVWLHGKREPGWREMMGILDGILAVSRIASRLQDQFSLHAPVRIGVGLNTGLASIGNVGSIATSDHTALGDVVNMAFRLESATRGLNCDLVLGQSTNDMLARLITIPPPFESYAAKLKGYDEEVAVHTAKLSALPAVIDALRANEGNSSIH
jgi:adenylate cyclase